MLKINSVKSLKALINYVSNKTMLYLAAIYNNNKKNELIHYTYTSLSIS